MSNYPPGITGCEPEVAGDNGNARISTFRKLPTSESLYNGRTGRRKQPEFGSEGNIVCCRAFVIDGRACPTIAIELDGRVMHVAMDPHTARELAHELAKEADDSFEWSSALVREQ